MKANPDTSAQLLEDQAHRDWKNECVGKCPNPNHTESSAQAERDCPYCRTLIALCNRKTHG